MNAGDASCADPEMTPGANRLGRSEEVADAVVGTVSEFAGASGDGAGGAPQAGATARSKTTSAE
jgi:hypothetical protein